MEKHKKIKKNAEKNLRTGIEIWEEFSGFSHSKPRSISSQFFDALSDASLSHQTMIKRKCVRRSSDAALWKYSIFSEQQQIIFRQ